MRFVAIAILVFFAAEFCWLAYILASPPRSPKPSRWNNKRLRCLVGIHEWGDTMAIPELHHHCRHCTRRQIFADGKWRTVPYS